MHLPRPFNCDAGGQAGQAAARVRIPSGSGQREEADGPRALDAAGAKTTLISPIAGKIKAWQHDKWGDEIPVDMTLDQASADAFDALMLPGGVMNPDKLRTDDRAVQFTRQMFDAGKPIAAICHGPWLLVEADVVRNRSVTSWPSRAR